MFDQGFADGLFDDDEDSNKLASKETAESPHWAPPLCEPEVDQVFSYELDIVIIKKYLFFFFSGLQKVIQ